MKSKKLLIIIIVLLLLGAGGYYAWTYFSKPVAIVGVVKRGTAVKVSPANILVTESFTMEIKSEVGGRILESKVRLGQAVKAGDVLYKIDPTDQELKIAQIESDYKAAKASIAIGSPTRFLIAADEEQVRNLTRLVEQGRASQQQLDQAKRTLDQHKDQLASEQINNQKTLDTFENTLKVEKRARDKMTVTVANDGTISDISARAGDLYSGGPLCHVISRERLVQAQISEENIAGINSGLPVTLQLLGYGGRQFTGTVERVLQTADPATKRYIAYLKVDIPEEQLVPGLTGEANITVDKHENALVIEKRALLGNSVFVVRDGRAVLVPVSVGFTSLDQAEILSGVNEGDVIILESPATFRNGERVRVQKS